MGEVSKSERFQAFLLRLGARELARSEDDALRQIEEELNAIEDEMTDIPFDPDAFTTDGRMYPPLEDAARPVPGRPEVIRYRSRKHNTFIAGNGAIEIRDLNEVVAFTKPGADGSGVWA